MSVAAETRLPGIIHINFGLIALTLTALVVGAIQLFLLSTSFSYLLTALVSLGILPRLPQINPRPCFLDPGHTGSETLHPYTPVYCETD